MDQLGEDQYERRRVGGRGTGLPTSLCKTLDKVNIQYKKINNSKYTSRDMYT